MDYLKVAQNVLNLEANAILAASERIDKKAIRDVMIIFEDLENKGGQLIFSGVGKSGFIARKIASTFASLGLRSFFLHPVEALHGDLGRAKKEDTIVLISKSGTTEEIMKLVPFLPIPRERRIGLLGDLDSPIGQECHVKLDCSVQKEACLNNQAPTTSSTLALAMGDALAVLYEKLIGLSKEGFAFNHPGGILGKSLRMKVEDLMVNFNDCPRCEGETSFQDVILSMTENPVGACAILGPNNALRGIVVDGDIRRAFANGKDVMKASVRDFMTPSPVSVQGGELANKALDLMENRKSQITILPVLNEKDEFMGFLRLHDLLNAGFSLRN